MGKDYLTEFQTPPEVCRYMASLVPKNVNRILEPTKGIGNIVKACVAVGLDVCAPEDYFLMDKTEKFEAVVMNPPFSSKSAFMDNAPLAWKQEKGMKFGYRMLTECMQKTDVIIALMPWFTISDSDVRLRYLKSFGIKSITALPRKTFQYARIQTCVLELVRGHTLKTVFEVFDFLEPIPDEKKKNQVKIPFSIHEKELSLF